ncbi:MAG: PAS domain S-box protein [Nocardioidaceae bacterium]|nr:PAS domain S-box protein [Nocardioidaceae bacterium]
MVDSGSALVDRFETSLAPDPVSAGVARRFVRDHLDENRVVDGWVDTAELLVSELVTNALMHAGTGIGLAVSVFVGAVRVEVADGNPAHPVRRPAHETATTGRGLEFVELFSDNFGVIDSPSGKVSWFGLGPAPALVAATGPSRQSVTEDYPIVLMGVPLALFSVWQQHASAAVRECMLMSFSQEPHSMQATVVARANDAIGALSRAKPAFEFDEPSSREHADLLLVAAGGLASQFADLKRVLGETVSLARHGTVLVPPAPPEIIRFRDWVCDEVTRQSDGAAPVPWPEDTPATEISIDVHLMQWDVADIAGSSEALIAADDSNRILAVSDSAGELLGWEPRELVGRRIITIIPERLHESHIIGFLRFLLTGQPVMIGSPVTVPARRADGTEISIELSIKVLPRAGGRTAFIAALSPPP